MVRIKPTDAAWKDCPRSEECCVNDCPLSEIRYTSNSCDIESKCKFGKTGRKRIGEKWGLKNSGLTGRELAGKKKWDNLPKEVREERIAKLTRKSPIVQLSNKGYAIVPKKKVMFESHKQNEELSLQESLENEAKEILQ